jgi:hypothetical protein
MGPIQGTLPSQFSICIKATRICSFLDLLFNLAFQTHDHFYIVNLVATISIIVDSLSFIPRQTITFLVR